MSPAARPVPGEPLPVAPPSSGDHDLQATLPTTPVSSAVPTHSPAGAGPAAGPAAGPDTAARPDADRQLEPDARREADGLRDKAWATLRRQRPLSLRSRLVGMLLILLLAGFAVIGGVTHASMSARLNEQVRDDLSNATQRAISVITKQFNPNSPIEALNLSPGTLTAFYLGDRALSSPGYATPLSDAQSPDKPNPLGAGDAAIIKSLADQFDGKSLTKDVRLSFGDYRVLVQPVTVTANKASAVGALVVGLPLKSAQTTLATLDLSLVLVSLGGTLLIGTLGTVLISRSLRPLTRVSAVASAVAELPLDKADVDVNLRVAPHDAVPGTEVGNVGAALNSLLDNVDGALEVRSRSEARMRRFAADASHELRTPLAAIQGYSELIGATEALSDDGDRSLERVREQTRRMTELVENLLLLARLDEGRPPAAEPVDLTRLAADLTRDFTVAAPDHHFKLELDAERPVVVTGDEPQLNRVLQNLMSNARKHTSDGTTVTVSVRAGLNQRAVVSVRDTGEGIDPEFVDKVFDRFARADAARSGALPTTGLGLSIVKAIVEAHGGTISVRSVPGDTVFEVSLPLAPEATAA